MSRRSLLDVGQPVGRGRHLGGELGTPQPQHAAQLLDPEVVVDDAAHLVQGEAELLERDHPVEARELHGCVGAVAGPLVGPRGRQQPDPVVVTQHPHRHLAQAGELSDGQHVTVLPPDTV